MANDAINKTYPEVIIGEKLHVISEPHIHIVTLEKDADFVYHAHVTVYPTLEIVDYKKIATKIVGEDKKEIAETTDEEVKNIMDQVDAEVIKNTPDIENIIKTNIKAEKEMLQKSTIRSKFLDETLKELSEKNVDAWPEMFTDKDKAQILNIEIAKKEEVKVSEEEVSAEVVKLSMHISKEDIASGKIDEEKLMAYAHQILLNEKVFVSLGL
jgi:trigger factor